MRTLKAACRSAVPFFLFCNYNFYVISDFVNVRQAAQEFVDGEFFFFLQKFYNTLPFVNEMEIFVLFPFSRFIVTCKVVRCCHNLRCFGYINMLWFFIIK